jgi:hypothetical protein
VANRSPACCQLHDASLNLRAWRLRRRVPPNVVWLSAEYTTLYPRRQNPSWPSPWELEILNTRPATGRYIKLCVLSKWGSQDGCVGIATGWTVGIWFRTEERDFSLLHSFQTDSGTHPASYPVATGGSFPRDKPAGAWSLLLTSIWCRGQERWTHSSTPHTFSCRS